MNRAKLIIVLIVVSVVLVPSMFCLISGAALTAAEQECCVKMLSTCGDTQMEHSCCKPSTASSEVSLVAQAKPKPPVVAPAVIEALIGFRPEVQKPGAWFGLNTVVPEHPPSTP